MVEFNGKPYLGFVITVGDETELDSGSSRRTLRDPSDVRFMDSIIKGL